MNNQQSPHQTDQERADTPGEGVQGTPPPPLGTQCLFTRVFFLLPFFLSFFLPNNIFFPFFFFPPVTTFNFIGNALENLRAKHYTSCPAYRGALRKLRFLFFFSLRFLDAENRRLWLSFQMSWNVARDRCGARWPINLQPPTKETPFYWSFPVHHSFPTFQ